MAVHKSMVPDSLEKASILKILAEQYILDNQVQKGIDVAKAALFMQKAFFHDMINDQVQETLLFIAEALILIQEYDEALEKFD